MKNLGRTVLASLVAISLCGFKLRRQEAPPVPLVPPAAAPSQHAVGAETPLTLQMEKIDEAMLFLRRSLKDSAQDTASFEQIVKAQQACLTAKQLAPKMAAHVAESERAAFLRDYRKGMAVLLIEWAQLETALLDGDRDAAQASWKKLDRAEEDGHNQFTEGE